MSNPERKTETAPHPGVILKEEYLEELGISACALAKLALLPRSRIERVASTERNITADTATRLARVLGTTPEYWMDLQRDYDLAQVAQNDAMVRVLTQISPIKRMEPGP